jgi:hypothetical protein
LLSLLRLRAVVRSFRHKRLKGNDILRPVEARPTMRRFYAIRPIGRITQFRKLAVFNGGGTFYKSPR